MRSRQNARTKFLIGLEIILLIIFSIFLFRDVQYGIVYFVVIVLLLYNLKSMTESLRIDKEGITVTNWFTIEKRNYRFDQFDTVVMYVDPIETLGRSSLYLLKDKIIFCKIHGSNYENLDDLIAEIERIKRIM